MPLILGGPYSAPYQVPVYMASNKIRPAEIHTLKKTKTYISHHIKYPLQIITSVQYERNDMKNMKKFPDTFSLSSDDSPIYNS